MRPAFDLVQQPSCPVLELRGALHLLGSCGKESWQQEELPGGRVQVFIGDDMEAIVLKDSSETTWKQYY
jgi:hypothetical protein